MVGQVVPAFELTTAEGVPVTRADCARGITVLNFFAPADYHNFEQLRRTEPLRQKFAPRGVRWIHVHERHPTTDVTQEHMLRIMEKNGVNGELCFDLGNQVARSFNLMMYPTMVILNQSGVIEAVNEGNAEDLEKNVTEQLDALLDGRSLVPGPREELLKRRPVLSLVGQEAPAFSLDLRDDSKLSNASLSGASATVLNFISPDCRYCIRQAPMVRTLRNRFAGRGARFASVGMPPQEEMDDDPYREAMNQLCGSNAWARDADGAAAGAFKISTHPTLIVIDRGGVVRHVEIGAGEDVEAGVNEQIEAILGAGGKGAP
jgi:peroxiredoxin